MVTSNARAIAVRSAVFGMENDLGMKRQPDMDLNQYIRAIPDFPKPGILFRDITPLLGNADAFREAIARLADPYRDLKIDAIAAAEARGFIFAAPMAIELNAGFIPVRKPENSPTKNTRTVMISNMDPTRSRCIQMHFSKETAYWLSTICLQPVEPWTLVAN